MNALKRILQKFPSSLLHREGGFTLMESIVVLFLLSLFQMWFWQGTTHSQITLLRIVQRQKELRTLFVVKEITTQALHAVEIPFFLEEAPLVMGESFLSFDPKLFHNKSPFILSLDKENQELYLQIHEKEMTIGGISNLEITPITTPQSQKIYAIHLRFYTAESRYIDLYHYFLGVIP